VAIKRHEFHPKSSVAVATPIEADGVLSASASPSLLALSRGTMARSAVPTVQRSSRPAAFVDQRVAFTAGATSSPHMLCELSAGFSAVTALAWSATRAAVPLQTSDYACLLEAV
jgi:hypothetical protein